MTFLVGNDIENDIKFGNLDFFYYICADKK